SATEVPPNFITRSGMDISHSLKSAFL
ncbi:MAG: hypothetical protein RIT52_1461, partial [Pseudomonadota bacterium]